MQELFLINGYGVPKDIFHDENYRSYLNPIFNTIYDRAVREGVQPVIVFSGGKTDLRKPYNRSEAGEMAKYFSSLAKRPFVRQAVKTWKLERESRALSTLENLLFTRDILKQKYPKIKDITIAFETTRAERIHKVAQKVFAHLDSVTLLPVEFDVSPMRYDLELIEKKEVLGIEADLLALESPKNLKIHHQIFVDKLAMVRRAGPEHHQEAIRAWWQKSLEQLKDMKA